MKTVRITRKENETNIDNDWTNFLMGGCDRDEEPPMTTRHDDKYNRNSACKYNQNNSNVNNTRKKKITTADRDQCNSCDDDDNDDCDYSDSTRANEMKQQAARSSRAMVGTNECTNECKTGDGNNGDRSDTFIAAPPVQQVPTCSPIYISTKTKISFLNTPIDIKNVFWHIPVMPYASQRPGIIKKQIKFSCTTKEELEEIEAHTQKELDKNDGFVETQIIEHIDNPDGRIKFKDHRKINIGLSKKDILNCRSKKKRAFFNCFVLIIRVEDENSPPDARIFKEMHIKVFNTGKLEIPGIQHDDSLQNVIDILIRTLKIVVGEHIDCKKDNCETVLINSNFNCGFYIDRDKLYNILKYKYRINSNYDSCSYPGIQCKFFYYTGRKHISDHDDNGNDDNGNDKTIQSNKDKDKHHIQNGQQPATNLSDYIEISFMIFRTGSVLIVGKCEDYVLHDIYDFIKELFRVEFLNIYSHIIQPEDDVVKKHVPKLRTRIIVNDM
jgi:hypothetical protein